ncbi:putative tRNA pseudouridine synthase Pus10 [Cryptosporidium felis]|nr:putative tRNA pseudouridine synthase Pus10 [Cryptosporidium felis]
MSGGRNLCWRCEVRQNSFKLEDLRFGAGLNSTGPKLENTDRECDFCRGLLLIDDPQRFAVLKVPNNVKQVKRGRARRSSAAQRSKANPFCSYTLCEINGDVEINEKGEYLKDHISGIFSQVLNAAVSNQDDLRLLDAGISIEFAPELRVALEEGTGMSLKNCLRRLLISQSNLKINQESDLFLTFLFSSKTPSDLEPLDGFKFAVTVSYTWKSVYLLGRYIKLSRRISQSKWGFSDGNIPIDTSIEEVISDSLRELVEFGEATFSSSGREDVDVRMLGGRTGLDREKEDVSRRKDGEGCTSLAGGGRPFAVEISGLRSHHYLFYSNVDRPGSEGRSPSGPRKDFILALKAAILRISDSRIQAPELEFSDSQTVQRMNKQVGDRQKSYRCICHASSPISHAEFSEALAKTRLPIALNQRTPLRVLHRRANADRIREVYALSILPITSNYFILDLRTQAGTYIKEFVNGDLGRTRPSLGDILLDSLPQKPPQAGKLNVSIVQLDVLSIH